MKSISELFFPLLGSGDGSAVNVHALQARGEELGPQNPSENTGHGAQGGSPSTWKVGTGVLIEPRNSKPSWPI